MLAVVIETIPLTSFSVSLTCDTFGRDNEEKGTRSMKSSTPGPKFPRPVREQIYLRGNGPKAAYEVCIGEFGGGDNEIFVTSIAVARAIVRCLRQLAVEKPNLMVGVE